MQPPSGTGAACWEPGSSRRCCSGGLFFLNSWDFPTYMLIAVLAYALRSVRWRGKLDMAVVKEVLLFAMPMAVLGVLLYLPFYLSFQSQASGFGIVRVRSQLHHFLLIFGAFLFMTLGFLAVKLGEWRSRPSDERRPASRLLPIFAVVGLVAAVIMIGLQVWTTVSTLLFSSLAGVLVSLLLLFFLGLALFVLLTAMRDQAPDIFVILLVGVGCLVTLIPEWVYINDNFGGNLSRMNTVFKFFYQGWILLALASAYSVYYVAAVRPSGARITFSVPARGLPCGHRALGHRRNILSDHGLLLQGQRLPGDADA